MCEDKCDKTHHQKQCTKLRLTHAKIVGSRYLAQSSRLLCIAKPPNTTEDVVRTDVCVVSAWDDWVDATSRVYLAHGMKVPSCEERGGRTIKICLASCVVSLDIVVAWRERGRGEQGEQTIQLRMGGGVAERAERSRKNE